MCVCVCVCVHACACGGGVHFATDDGPIVHGGSDLC
jgi:hypothetical protein